MNTDGAWGRPPGRAPRPAPAPARVTAAAAAGRRSPGDPGDAPGGGLLPVLAARDVAVTDAAERMFPRTT
ncbi:hypothetical protein ACFQ6X_03840, partial [Streptomyces sp. NPDC056452]